MDGLMANPYTVTMQCMVEFSHGTLHMPSFLVSQNVVAVVYNPAPFFCMMMHVTGRSDKTGR